MKLIFSRSIKPKGQLAAVLNLFLAVLAVGLIAVFAFELSRYFLARDELKTNTEAAALCCETQLVSSGNPSDATNQSSAIATALTLFQQNSILGQSMSTASSTTTTSALSPSAGQAQICFQFLDPVLRTPITTGSSGALIQATGAYCYTPAFGQFLGMGNAQFTFEVSAFSGVPEIDVMLVFDVSSTMDDETTVTPVQRGGGGGTGIGTGPGNGSGGGTGGTGGGCVNPTGTNYQYVNSSGGTFLGGTLTQLAGNPGLTGTSGTSGPNMNVLSPQNLEGSANLPNNILFAESPGALTNNLTGNANGTPAFTAAPGNVCICNQPPPSGGPVTYSNNHKQSDLIAAIKPAKTKSKKDLRQLCAAIDNAKNSKQPKIKIGLSQLDDNLSKISFLPLFSAYPTQPINPYQGPTGSPVPPYICPANSLSYTGSSHTNLSGGGQPNFTPSPTTVTGVCPTTTPYAPSTVAAGTGYANYFTDLLANIDGNNQFAGNYTSGLNSSYTYTDMGSIAEAWRGTLENSAVANSSFVDYNGLGAVPTSGYNVDYVSNAQLSLQPLNNLLYAASNLVNELASVSNVHFGFVAFSDSAGNSNTGTTPAQYSSATPPPTGYVSMISSWFPVAVPVPDGSGNTATSILPPLPFVPLNPGSTATAANLNIITQIPPMRPNGNRNTAAGLQAAIQQFTGIAAVGSTPSVPGNARPGANTAIVLFTDGAPTEAGVSNSQALQDAIAQAQAAGAANIPVYCVCVADPNSSPSDDSAEDAAYGDISTGIAGVSAPGPGTGPKYYRVDWTDGTSNLSSLNTAVDNIVRQMIGMMH